MQILLQKDLNKKRIVIDWRLFIIIIHKNEATNNPRCHLLRDNSRIMSTPLGTEGSWTVMPSPVAV